jgi:hypothetical protein
VRQARLARRTMLASALLAWVLVLLAPVAATGAMNDNAEMFCIAIPTPPLVSWETTSSGRIYKFQSAGQASTPPCPPAGLELGKAQNFGLGVNVTGTWDGKTKKATEAMTFGISMHPIQGYNGDWALTLALQCSADPWFQGGKCKLLEVTTSKLPTSPYDALYSAFQFSAPYPKTSLTASQKEAIKTATTAKAVVAALEKSITIKSPKAGQVHPLGAPLLVEITNPYKTNVAVTVSPKGNTWAGSGAVTLTTTGTSVSIAQGQLATAGEWTVRAQAKSPNTVSGSGGATVNFLVKGTP